MSTFTIPLKKVITLTGGTTEIVNGQTVITGGNIGLDHYPIFKDDYRPYLNGRIIDRYWNREIGLETIDMFQLAMRRKMNEIMPYYNQLYNSTLVEYDPLATIDIKTLSTGNMVQEAESTAVNTGQSESTAASRSVGSDTPQTMLSADGDYATSGSDVNSASANTSTGNQTGTENQTADSENTSQTTGYQGVASDLIMRYRESLINVDLMVLGELEELFMLVWDNGDSYTNRRGYML